MAIEPISPKEAISKKNIPDAVIESFNELITEKIDLGGTAIIHQDDVIARIINKGLVTQEDKEVIFSKKWLDVENIYKNNGWDVTYDKPGFNETYQQATFTFKTRGQKK